MDSTTRCDVLGLNIHVGNYEEAVAQVTKWAGLRESRYVCCANVHMTMEAHDSLPFQKVVNGADLVVPDGVPLVWAMNRLGYPEQRRVYGPDLALHVYKKAEQTGLSVGFLGGRPEVLEQMLVCLHRDYPQLSVAYAYSPPFRALSEEERDQIIGDINESGTQILMVGLGCPKQERWMNEHRGKVQAVMMGIGAAFDFHAGSVRQAPSWVQDAGMEWAFRLAMEPRRLAKRYIKHNPRFVQLVLLQLAKEAFRTK